MTFDDNLEDEVKVTIIATGFQIQNEDAILKNPSRDILGRKTIKSRSQNFISRGISSVEEREEIIEPKRQEEDIETPAFVRRKLSQ